MFPEIKTNTSLFFMVSPEPKWNIKESRCYWAIKAQFYKNLRHSPRNEMIIYDNAIYPRLSLKQICLCTPYSTIRRSAHPEATMVTSLCLPGRHLATRRTIISFPRAAWKALILFLILKLGPRKDASQVNHETESSF